MVKPAGLTLITLMHPKRVPVLFVTIDNSLHELQEVNSRKFGSWFIDQRIASPGSYYMVNRIDPRYLCLPYLEKNGGNYSPLEQIIQNEDGCDRMPLNNHLDWKLGDMCDETDRLGDLLLYRFNKVKAMEWLKAKVQRTASVVAEQRQRNRRTSAMYSSNFNFSGQSTVTAQSSVSEANVERVDIVDSLQIICEYLSDAWVQLLTSEYNVTEEEIYPKISTKRKTDWESALEVSQLIMSNY